MRKEMVRNGPEEGADEDSAEEEVPEDEAGGEAEAGDGAPGAEVEGIPEQAGQGHGADDEDQDGGVVSCPCVFGLLVVVHVPVAGRKPF